MSNRCCKCGTTCGLAWDGADKHWCPSCALAEVERLCAIIARCVEANETGDYYNDDVWREAAEAARET